MEGLIVLGVIIGMIWVLIKIIQSIADGPHRRRTREAQKDFEKAVKELRQKKRD